MSRDEDVQADPMPLPATDRSVQFQANNRVMTCGSRTLIMGVVNVTPDSFFDGGRWYRPDAAVKHACALVEQGADLLDIGAESSRPGSDPIGPEEELRRLLPVVRDVCGRVDVPVSIDTTKAEVAQRTLDAGASIINDISALRFDPRMASVVAQFGAGLILTHMQGVPKTMQQAPRYDDVVRAVNRFWRERMEVAASFSISPNRVLLDPGFGFGKTLAHNLALVARLDEFMSMGRPLVVGVSRKAFIGEVLGRSVADRLMGTAAVVAAAVLKGVHVVRVHDVSELRDVVRMADAIRNAER
jgi:dihydropteroate synthase